MQIVLVASIAGKQATVKKGGGLVVIHTTSVEVVDVETKAQSFVGIDGKVGFEPFFTITAIEALVIGEVSERRQGVGKGHIVRT